MAGVVCFTLAALGCALPGCLPGAIACLVAAGACGLWLELREGGK